jgi:tRNA(fMet)-specific endonuclease VapC
VTRRISIDTSTYTHLRRGHAEVAQRLSVAHEILISTVVIGELLGGFRNGSKPLENEAVLARFLQEDGVRVLPTTEAVANHYGAIYAALKRAGRPIPTNDIWIAAATQEAGAHLLTFVSDFAAIKDLSWTRLT